MATVYSANYSTGSATYTRVMVSYSGTSATATLLYSRTNTYSGATSATNATFTFGGASTTFSKTFYGQQTDAVVASVNFSISTSGGTYSGSTANAGLLGFSGSVTIPSQGSAPSGGYINGVSSVWNSSANEIQVSTTSAGVTNPGGVLTELNWNLCESTYVSGIARRSIALSSNGASSTLSNSLSTYTGNTIDVAPNKRLYLGLYAANSIGGYRYDGGTIITVPGPATVTFDTATSHTATFNYLTTADSGYYPKTIQYSLDGGATWVDITTIFSGEATAGSFTISGLIPGVSYTLQSRISTTAGFTSNVDVAFSTDSSVADKNIFYGSANNEAEEISKIYGSENNASVRIKKIYGSINGRTILLKKWH